MKKIFLIMSIFLLMLTITLNAKNIEAKNYNHIVSLTLSGDEMLLGLVAENRIAGLSGKINEDREISHIWNKVKKIPKVEGNLETLIYLEPDFIIVADWTKKEILKQIEDIGATVFVYKTPSNFEEQKKLIKELGRIVKEDVKADKIIKDMDNRLSNLQKKISQKYKGAKPRILMYTTFQTTSGKNSTFDDMVKKIGGINVASMFNGSQNISKEKVIELDPDIIIVPVSKKYSDKDKFKKFLFEDPSFKNMKAIKNKKVYFMEYKDLSPTSQYMIDSIEEFGKVIYNL